MLHAQAHAHTQMLEHTRGAERAASLASLQLLLGLKQGFFTTVYSRTFSNQVVSRLASFLPEPQSAGSPSLV